MQGILWLGWLQGSDSFRTPWDGNELFEIENAGGCNHFFPGMLWDFLGWFGMGKHISILLFPPEGSLLITHCLGEKHLDLVKQGLWEFLASVGVEIQVGSSGREYIPGFSLDLYPKVGMLQVGTAQQSLENTRAAGPGILHGAGRRIWSLTGPKGLQTGRNFFQCSYSLAST